MNLNGETKTARMLLRVTEEMAREVRLLAELEHRTIQDTFRFLIARGLHAAAAARQTSAGNGRQQSSTEQVLPTFAEEEAKATLSTPVSFRQPRSVGRPRVRSANAG